MENIVSLLLKKNGINDLLPIYINDKKTEYWCYSNNKTFYFCDSAGNSMNRKDLGLEEGILALKKGSDGYYIVPEGENFGILFFINRDNILIENEGYSYYTYFKLSSQYYVLNVEKHLYSMKVTNDQYNNRIFSYDGNGRIVDSNGIYSDLRYCASLSKNRFFLSKDRYSDIFLCDECLNIKKKFEPEGVSKELYIMRNHIIVDIKYNNISLYNEDGALLISQDVYIENITNVFEHTYHDDYCILIPSLLKLYYITCENVDCIDLSKLCGSGCLPDGIQLVEVRKYEGYIVECTWDNEPYREYYRGEYSIPEEMGYLYINIDCKLIYSLFRKEFGNYNESWYTINSLETNPNDPILYKTDIKRGVAHRKDNDDFEIILPPIFDRILDLKEINNKIETIAIYDDYLNQTKHWNYYIDKQCILDLQLAYGDKRYNEILKTPCLSGYYEASEECEIKRISNNYVKYVIDGDVGIVYNGKIISKPEFEEVICFDIVFIFLAKRIKCHNYEFSEESGEYEWVIINNAGKFLVTEICTENPVISMGFSVAIILIYFQNSKNLYSYVHEKENFELVYNAEDSTLIKHYKSNFVFKTKNEYYILVNQNGKSLL